MDLEATMSTRSSNDVGVAAATVRARLLLRLDGVFEAVLGLCLVLSPVIGLYSAFQLPAPATKPVVVVVGLLLLPLLPILWRSSRAPRRQLVLALAAANGAGAAILVLWVLIGHRAFHPAGAVFVLVAAAILVILATLQARAALVSPWEQSVG
jgi:hypothetical protein